MATLEVINIGTSPNDGSGDPLRTAFTKVNNNFANLWATGYNTIETLTYGNATQVIFEYPANIFTQASFQVNSLDSDSTNSQNIVINASLNGALDSVRFSAHSTVFHGNAVTNYSMDVISGVVYLYATPFVLGQVTHFITYQVTYDPLLTGTPLIIDQSIDTALSTETTNSVVTTEG